MGLGSVQVLGLAKAREIAQAKRFEIRVNHIDPMEQRHAGRGNRGITFDKAAEQYIEAQRGGWRDPRAAKTWASTLKAYASPTIGRLPVANVTTQHVLEILQPIWSSRTETATRVRGRIEAILDWCKVQGYRDGANVATWKGHIALLLPKKSAVKKPTRHHAAVPLDMLPSVYRTLSKSDDLAAAATRFCILTAARPSEAAGARWSEIDLVTATWIVPPERMKKFREHRVALSDQAVEILQRMTKLRGGARNEVVFPGTRAAASVSVNAMREALREAGGGDATLHGTARSCFDDFAHERTNFAPALVDRALAHVTGSKTTQAYRRTDLLDQRRALMQRWEDFLDG
jgi:integrase